MQDKKKTHRPPFLEVLEFFGLKRTIIDIGSGEVRFLETLGFQPFLKVIQFRKTEWDTMDTLKESIAYYFKNTSKTSSKRAEVSLSTTSAIPLLLQFPNLPRKRIVSILPWEIEKNIPLSLKEVVYASKIYPVQQGIKQKQWNVFSAIFRKSEIDLYDGLFKNLGVTVDAMYYSPYHIHSLIKNRNESYASGFISFYSNCMDIAVVYQKEVVQFKRFSGKIKESAAITDRNIIEFFEQYKKISFIPYNMVILHDCGGMPEDAAATIRESLEVPVRELESDDLEFSPGMIKPEAYDLFGLVSAGGSKINLASSVIKSNHQARVFIRSMVAAALLLDLILAFILPGNVISYMNYKTIEQLQNKAVEKQSKSEKDLLSRWQRTLDVIKYKNQMDDFSKKIQTAKSSGIESSHLKILLAEISKVIPDSVYIKSLLVQNGKGEMEGFSANSDGLEGFVSALTSSKQFLSVDLKLTEMQKDNSVHFIISFGANR